MQDKNAANLPSKPSFFNNPEVRAVIFQILLVLAIVWFGYYLVNNVLDQYEAKGINAGFSFLSDKAGFDIAFKVIPFNADNTYGRLFIVGILNTLLVSVIGIFFATILGFSIGIARLSGNWLISKVALIYVETFRNIPLLLQILFWYGIVLTVLPKKVSDSWAIGESFFMNVKGLSMPKAIYESGAQYIGIAFIVAIIAVFFYRKWAKKSQDITGKAQPIGIITTAILLGLPLLAYFIAGSPVSFEIPQMGRFSLVGGITVVPELLVLGMLALSIYTASFIAEIVRSGINAVSTGQKEAADALGLSAKQKLSLVVVPQAMRIIIPQLTSQYLNLIKNSSLAMAIGFSDLVGVFMGTALNQTGRAVEIVSMTMGVYLVISLLVAFFMNWYNSKMALVEK